jgi:hypothetical protein
MRRLSRHISFCFLLAVAAQTLPAQSKPNVAVPVATFTRVRIITTGAAPGEPWVSIGAVRMDRSGGIYAAFPDENTIRHFSSSGTFLRSIGRKGSGPGEFERLAGIGWIGDTLWAMSRGGQRFELFRPSGAHILTQTALATSHDGSSANASAMLQDGWIAYNGSIRAEAMVAKQPRVTPMLVVQPPNGGPKEYARIATGTLTLAECERLRALTVDAAHRLSGCFRANDWSDHNIWLRGPDLSEPNVEWTVLNTNLEPQFRVMLPADFVVKAAMRDDVWGTSLDDDDVPYLIHFRRAGSAR